MTSEIRANKQTNRVGLGTVEYTDTGIIVSGIVTCTELSGLTALNISGVGTANTLDINGDIDVDGCLLYTSPSPRDPKTSRMPSSA